MSVRRPIAALVGLTIATSPAVSAQGASTTTVFGVIASTQGSPPDSFAEYVRLYQAHRARYGGGPIGIRIFARGRLPLPTDTDQAGSLLAWAAEKHPEEAITISHKIRDDARLRTLLDWVQVKKLRVSIIYCHEAQIHWFDFGDENGKPDTYRKVYRAYRKIIAAHPAHPRVTLEKNLLWWSQRYDHTPENDWHRFIERDDPADLVSWDTYSFPGMPTGQGHYATPDDFFRYARDVWKEFRLPWAVGEIGTVVQDGTGADGNWDPSGAKFATWVRQITDAARTPGSIDASYAGMPPAIFVKWWGALDAQNRDLSLEQNPGAVTYYRHLVKTFPIV